MHCKIERTRALRGRVRLPASKSYSIRAFIIAACGGRSRIIGSSDCDDARVARKVAGMLGAQVEKLSDRAWLVEEKRVKRPLREVDVCESGTVLRFILPLLSLSSDRCRITGQGTLRGRPNHHLTAVLRRQGVRIRGTGPRESVPIVLSGGDFRGGKIHVEGSLSSQFISALMIACPQLAQDSTLTITGRQVVSADYIGMTERIVKKAGIRIQRRTSRVFHIAGSQKYRGLGTFTVPSDAGLAAFLLAGGALTDSNLVLEGCYPHQWPQADGHIFQFLKRMNVTIRRSSKTLKLRGPVILKGGLFSLKDCPDLLPVMAVLALFAKGTTRLVNIRHARVKESDRVTDLRRELVKIGAHIREKPNELIIEPQRAHDRFLYREDVILDAHHDHRLAMAWAVLGLRCGVGIKGMECVSKSYPGFVRDLRRLGGKIKIRG